MLAGREDATTIDQGWPWPWNDSGTTDYSYYFRNNQILWAGNRFAKFPMDSSFMANYATREDLYEENDGIFPDMSSKKNITFGPRSGILSIG